MKNYMVLIFLLLFSIGSRATIGPIMGSTVVCAGAPVTFTDTTAHGTWSSSSPSVATIASATGAVTGVAAGTAVISYSTVTGYVTTTITIDGSPSAGTISGLSSICVGSLLILSDGATGGAWSATNTHATVSAGFVTGISEGIDTINYTVTNSCSTATATFPVTLNPLPVADTISSPSIVCEYGRITLTDASIGGIWGADNANATIASDGVVTGVTPGPDTLFYVVYNSCGAATATKLLTVNPAPIVGAVMGASSVCPGDTIILTDTTIGGVWSAGGTFSTVAGGIVTGVAPGSQYIIYTFTNSCGSTIAEKYVTTNTPPSAGTISRSAICVSSSPSISFSGTGGTGATIRWSATNGHAAIAAADSGCTTCTSVNYRGISAGLDTIMCIRSNVCATVICTGVISIDTPITVDTISGGPIFEGNTYVCAGATITLADATTGGTWANLGRYVSLDSLGVVTGDSSGSDDIRYTVSNGCGGYSVSEVVAVIAAPIAATITGLDTVCLGNHAQYNTDGYFEGEWSTTTGNTIGSGGGLSAMTTGYDTVFYTITNPCGTAVTKFPVYINNCNERVNNINNAATSINVYPNPAASSLTISSPARITDIAIINIVGQTVYTHQCNTTSLEVNVSGLPWGVYFVKVNGSDVRRFVKE